MESMALLTVALVAVWGMNQQCHDYCSLGYNHPYHTKM